jgi:hypothetical protein
MYKLEGLKTKAIREENRKIQLPDGPGQKKRHLDRRPPPAPPSLVQEPLTSSVKRFNDIADECQNMLGSLSSLTRKMEEKLVKDGVFTKRDVEDIIFDMRMAAVDRMRKSLDDFRETVNDNFGEQKKDTLREQYALMNEQSWLGSKINLKPLPEDPLQMISVAASETTRTMKKYNSDKFFTNFVEEIAPLFEKFPSVHLRRRSVNDIKKSIRNGDDMRHDLITNLLLTMHHSIAGQEDEDADGTGWCRVLLKQMAAVLKKKDEPIIRAVTPSSTPKEEDHDSDSYSYTDESDDDAATPRL